jgi:type IV pilus assembly protein PilP
LSRPPQFLEQFPIEALIMKGTLRRTNGSLYGLIQAPEGGVVRVEKGNYLGKNYGRIVEITPSQISIVEIVPNGRDGFIERPRNLVMIDVGA